MNDDAVDRSPEALAGVLDPASEPNPASIQGASSNHAEGKDGVRKKRADAGKPREKKETAPDLVLSETQANRLRILLEDVIDGEKAYWAAEAKRNRAMVAYNAYVESLRAK